ncbi:hypothetical protein HYN48_11275 [Flavobacterium magnum]|uniref:Uncharacterized protein n=1 Tax=Flavobacterium magnum TaxID=2162713 RepID=A0A2S0RHL5_9FLAO|nr:hypothetical protein [Flavobacterium magnum]AWA30621.1 hypothetical protein HYN48_11275 [Flavobacterium magnum]
MLRKLAVIGLLFCSLSFFGQSASMENKKGMKSNFSRAALGAWQQHSLDQVRDYFQYLEMLANETTSDALKAQLKENIYALFNSRNTMVIDITTADKAPVTLEALLTKMDKFNQPLKITLKKKRLSSYFSDDSWMNIYTLEIAVNNNIMVNDVSQKIYFQPQLKDFGGRKKEVWSIQLGEME